MPKSEKAILTIYDVNGRIIYQQEGNYQEGYNEIILQNSDLENAGVFYYELKTATEKAIKKLILVD